MMYQDRLTKLREDKNLKQYEVANILKLYKGLYNQYEREYLIIPTKHLNTLCNYFHVSFDYIFGFTNNPNYQNEKENINKEISGKRLKQLRKDHKLTQEKMAKDLKVSRTTITEYERGTNIIATPFLYTISKLYNISADYLLGKIDE